MKLRKTPFLLRMCIAFALVFVGLSIHGQKAESKTVVFRLNNMPDTDPPAIRILAPEFDEQGHFTAIDDELEILGEVHDDSRIRFVSVNTDIQVVNETGVFASSIQLMPGENRIQVRSMDEHENLSESYYYIHYTPRVLTLADKIRKDATYFGLIIGIESYEDPDIPDLDNPIKDAGRVYATLTKQYYFEEENVTFLKNPDRAEIIQEMDALRKRVTTNDNLLIFFAGHGFWDQDANVGYWLPSDASRQSTVNWFRNSTLVDYIQAIKSKHTLLITDACFAGSIFKARSVKLDKEVVYDRIYEIPSRKAMTSGAMTEVPDQSAFVKYFVKQLDSNKEVYLSSEELFSSFRKAVISNSNVLPQYGEIQNVENEGGDFIFLKRVNKR